MRNQKQKDDWEKEFIKWREDNIEKEIEKIKALLIAYDSDYFGPAFCEHEMEEMPKPDFEGKYTNGTIPDERIFWCKKCGTILNDDGSPKKEII